MDKINLFHTTSKVAKFALPMSTAAVINMVISFISMMMVALLGKNELAAGALAVPTFITIMTITATVFYSVGILISHQKGQGKAQSEVGLVVQNGFWLALLLAFPAALVLWHIDKLLLLIGQNANLIASARGYFHFAALSMFPLLLNTVIGQFYAGTGRPHYTLWIALVSLPFTILLAYILILGHFGFPILGLSGVTCATLIVQSLLLFSVILLIYYQEKTNESPYHIFHGLLQPSWTVCKSIFVLGMPIGMQFGGELAAMTAATYLMGYFGATALAASQIVSQYAMIVIVLILGLTQALSLLISEAYGKKNNYLIKEYLKASMILLMLSCLLVSILFLKWPKMLIQFYMSHQVIDDKLEHLTIIFFAISALFLLLDGLRHLLSGALRGLHDSKGPMRLGIFAMWVVALPMSYIVGITCNGGPIGLRLGFICGYFFAVIVLSWRLLNKLRLQENLNPLKL